MKNFIIHTLLFWILLLVFGAIFSSCEKDNDQPTPPVTDQRDLTVALEQIHQSSQFPGFAVSIVQCEEIVYQQALGEADIEQGRPYTNTTIQPTGSIKNT